MGKRIAAAVVAVLMIVGALVWRSRGSTPIEEADPIADTTTVVCAPDLIAACRSAATAAGMTARAEGVDETLAGATVPEAWVTVSPLPAAATFGTAVELTETPIASSPLSLVVLNDRVGALTATCGDPVEWVCLGTSAGTPWSEIGGDASWGTVRPGLSPRSTAVGAFSIGAAVTAYFNGRSIDSTDARFISWARQFARAVPASSLSAGTAVETIQVRSSTLDIAAGTTAELADANVGRFATVEVGDDLTITVVVATADGVQVPQKFVDALRAELTDNGWTAATAASPAMTGGDVRAAIAAWEEMQ